MTREEQQNILKLSEQYNSTDKAIKQSNINKAINQSGYKVDHIADKLGITKHAIYQWRKNDPIRSNAPSFETALQLAELLDVDVKEFLKNDDEEI